MSLGPGRRCLDLEGLLLEGLLLVLLVSNVLGLCGLPGIYKQNCLISTSNAGIADKVLFARKRSPNVDEMIETIRNLRKEGLDWEAVAETSRLSIQVCKSRYYASLAIDDSKKELLLKTIEKHCGDWLKVSDEIGLSAEVDSVS
jgi:hypothetical protein